MLKSPFLLQISHLIACSSTLSRSQTESLRPCQNPGGAEEPSGDSLPGRQVRDGPFFTISSLVFQPQRSIWRDCCALLCLVALTLCNPMDCILPGSSLHGILQAGILEWLAMPFSGGIFLTQGWNPGLRWILYHLSHQGSPRILEWVPYPFSRGSSQPRNQSGVSCIAGGFFTS